MIEAALQNALSDPQAGLAAQSAVCVLARLLPVVSLVPAFGGAWVPWPCRVAIGVVLAAALTPPVMAGQTAPLAAGAFGLAVAGNLVVGLVLGFAASLVFHAAHAAGSLIDLSRGAHLGAALAPAASVGGGPTGRFFALLAVTLFFVIGGHQLLLAALADSFRLVPPTAAGAAAALAGPAARDTILALTASLFVLALQLAAPALIVVLLVDLLAGGLHRLALPVNAFFLALTLRGTLAVGATFLALGVAAVTLRGQFADMVAAVHDLAGG